MNRILITGGAGFVGSNLAIRLKERYPRAETIAFDNLKRRGSELILLRLKKHGITFIHGDVRVEKDLLEVGGIDLLVDCAAEPSVLAGVDGSPAYVIDTNLKGTVNSLEMARLHHAALIFLSTSRIYPVEAVNALRFREAETRFELTPQQNITGASDAGISEVFPLGGARSIYGASKLCSEFLITEFIDTYKIQAVVNRCGVLTGPWQMGKVDQGVIVLWLARHIFGKELSYIGYGGQGKQVRDILHIDDLFTLIEYELDNLSSLSGETFNVGGGREVSVSLQELTMLCREYTGNEVQIRSELQTRPNDIRIYLSDCRKVRERTGWVPMRGVDTIISQTAEWITSNRSILEPILA